MERKTILSRTTHSQEETAAIGSRLGEYLDRATLALIGDLGAGKTLLSRSICIGAGVDQDVISSPTFTLINEYSGRIVVQHMDTYRLDPEGFVDLGLDEIFAGPGLKLIEWADRIEDHLPSDTIFVVIEHLGEMDRQLTFSSADTRWEELLSSQITV